MVLFGNTNFISNFFRHWTMGDPILFAYFTLFLFCLFWCFRMTRPKFIGTRNFYFIARFFSRLIASINANFMMYCMRTTLKEFKIFYAIIPYISVNMMDNFIIRKFSPQMFSMICRCSRTLFPFTRIVLYL